MDFDLIMTSWWTNTFIIMKRFSLKSALSNVEFTRTGIQSKITMQTKTQENAPYPQSNNQWGVTDTKMTKVIELANTDVEAYYKCSPRLQECRRTNKPDEENGR